MISFPNAKINLGLTILSRREDGYHEIESCFYPIDLNDSLEIIESTSFSFHSYGLQIPGNNNSNLCVKAYEILRQDFQIPPVAIHLLKKIPMGAGLGGGSADGAFTLTMLNELFDLNLTDTTLEEYALQLGSDCPFFMKNKPAIARGRGEQLQLVELDLTKYRIEIQNPGIHISTQEAYGGIKPQLQKQSISEIISQPIYCWKDKLFNDFERYVFQKYPQVSELKKTLYEQGAIYASMTGSGSTVFGIFEK
jgi:4-diphosphocytidyl-2-C-methyl-D-erythritol kinase